MNRNCMPRLLGLMARVAISGANNHPDRTPIGDLLCMLDVLGYDSDVVKEAVQIANGEKCPEWLAEYKDTSRRMAMERSKP